MCLFLSDQVTVVKRNTSFSAIKGFILNFYISCHLLFASKRKKASLMRLKAYICLRFANLAKIITNFEVFTIGKFCGLEGCSYTH